MIGWVGDIEQRTIDNTTFRTVLFTGEHSQLTVMRITAGEDIGREVHPDHDQFLRIEQGSARVELGASEDTVDETYDVEGMVNPVVNDWLKLRFSGKSLHQLEGYWTSRFPPRWASTAASTRSVGRRRSLSSTRSCS